MNSEQQRVGAAFAEHLGERSSRAALRFSRALASSGDTRRAEFLHAFAVDGEHRRPAEWWSPQSLCHAGLMPPPHEDMSRVNLWFDPLDATWSIALPFPDSGEGGTFFAWFPLERVTEWQLAGVHEIAPDAPPTTAQVTAQSAWRYCEVVGKNLTGWPAWSLLARVQGMDTVLRLWDDSPGEIGLGGQTDDDAHIFHRGDLAAVTEPDSWPDVVDVRARHDVSFRAYVRLQSGLGHGDLSLERTWQR